MAVFQYASEFAHDSLNWAVAEAQKCFHAPLDHTRHHIEPFPELVNAPTGNPYFDRMLKSDTGLKFLETSGPPQAGSDKSPGVESPEKPTSIHKDATALDEPSSNLKVVVLGEDGTHTTCKHTFANVASEEPGNDASIDDTLTRRSSPNAVAEAVQSVLQQLADSRTDNDSAAENIAIDQHVQLEATYSDSDDEPEKSSCEKAKDEATSTCEQIERSASDQVTQEEVAEPSRASRAGVRDEVSSWEVGSVLEIFSASANAWFPGLVTQVVVAEGGLEMLTVQFWPTIDDSKQKTACRESTQFASIGSHCGDRLPPGFDLVFSKSRPGTFVFLDGTTGLKYESLELIWAVHFRRWLDRPVSNGMETISCVAPPVAISRAATHGIEVKASEFGLATQIVPPIEEVPSPIEDSSVPCSEKAIATADENAEGNAHNQDLPAAALFLEAMAFESPGAFSCEVQSKVESAQDTIEDPEGELVHRATFEVVENLGEQDGLADELLTDEFFASLPEPCNNSPKQRNLTNLFSPATVPAAVL